PCAVCSRLRVLLPPWPPPRPTLFPYTTLFRSRLRLGLSMLGCSMPPHAGSARRRLPGKLANAFDHIADGAYTPEFLRLEPAPRQRLQLHDKIDGIDAVDVEILV